jgi:hypothetical protein
MSRKAIRAKQIAAEFGQLLRWHMSAEDYRSAVLANRENPNGETCATHEYIDSNVSMIAAFQLVIGREPAADSDDDANLINAAWAIWRARDSWIDDERLGAFIASYIETALWSSTAIGSEEETAATASGGQFDSSFQTCNFDQDDLSEKLAAKVRADCIAFFEGNFSDIGDGIERAQRAGHDFWLTRNRHGAGFWDGDWPKDAGRRLTDQAHPFGSSDWYLGDDGKIHGE